MVVEYGFDAFAPTQLDPPASDAHLLPVLKEMGTE
jgi:hypothetical protein